MKAETAIELREHRITEGVALTAEEATELARSPALVEVRPTRTAGRYDLRASSVVGTLVLPTRVVVIRPKVPVGRLLWLLELVGRVPPLGPRAMFDEDADLLTCMQAQYAHLLGQALGLGPVRDYVAVTDDVQALRGAPDLLHVAARRFGLFPPIRCSFDEFSADTEVNRLLLAGARLLSRWRRTEHAQRLESLAARLEGVREVRYDPERVPEPRMDRRHEHVVPALRMAQMILRRASFEFRDGRVRALSFLVDMNRVYEDVVIEGLRRVLALGRAELVAHPAGLYLDIGHRFQLEPDGLWRAWDGAPLVVLDAKYKVDARALREDLYQMVAYTSALGIEKAVLVYADVPPDEHELTHGPRVLVVRLPLDGTPEELEARFVAAATRIAAFAGVEAPKPRPGALRLPVAEQLGR